MKGNGVKEANMELIVQSYKDFVQSPIPKGVDNYEFREGDVLVHVFAYMPEGVVRFDINPDDGEVDMRHMVFSIAKVYAAGEGSAYRKGDIVRLRDYETATIDNPAYALYKEAMQSRPLNAKVSDKIRPPHKKINNLMRYYQDRIFVVHPLKPGNSMEDYFVFLLNEAHIVCKIKDPYAYVDYC